MHNDVDNDNYDDNDEDDNTKDNDIVMTLKAIRDNDNEDDEEKGLITYCNDFADDDNID